MFLVYESLFLFSISPNVLFLTLQVGNEGNATSTFIRGSTPRGRSLETALDLQWVFVGM